MGTPWDHAVLSCGSWGRFAERGQAPPAALAASTAPGALPAPQKPGGLPPPPGCPFPRLCGVSPGPALHRGASQSRPSTGTPPPPQTPNPKPSPRYGAGTLGEASQEATEGGRGGQGAGRNLIYLLSHSARGHPGVLWGGPGGWRGSEARGRLVVDVVGVVAPHRRRLRLEDASTATRVGAGGTGARG